MSMNNYSVYGYGFIFIYNEELLINKDKLIAFIKKHKSTFCKSETETELYNDMQGLNEYDLKDLFENYCCDNTGIVGIGAVISNIMTRETGINFGCYPEDLGCDTPAAIVFLQLFPWQFNEKEKNLTKERLYNICEKYMDELGLEDKPNWQSLEYYG